jgi:V/A-type H+-transporting ATPase subunit C
MTEEELIRELMIWQENVPLTPAQVIFVSLLITVMVIIIVSVSLGYFRIVLNIAAFAAPIARVKAMGTPYILPENLTALMEAQGLQSLVSKIREAGLPLEEEAYDVISLQRAIDLQYFREMELLERSGPAVIRPYLRAYLSVLEMEQMKRALIAVHERLGPSHREKILLPVGEITPSLIQKITGATGIEDLVTQMMNTRFGLLLMNAIPEYREQGTPLPLLLLLDRSVFEELNRAVRMINPGDAAPLLQYNNIFSDISNIRIVLRAKQMGIPPVSLEKYLIPGGSEFSPEQWKKIYEYPTSEEIIGHLMGTSYRDILGDALPAVRTAGSIQPLEQTLDQYLLTTALRLGTIYSLGAGPILAFIVAKKYEIHNLHIAFTGTYEGLPPERMKKVLIMGKAA